MKPLRDNLANAINDNRYLLGGVVVFTSLSWSWLFWSRAADLTGSRLIGFIFALLTFICIVLLSAALFAIPLVYFAKRYNASKKINAWFLFEVFVVWAFFEYAVALFANQFWIGPGSSLDSTASFTSLTPLAAFTPLKHLGRILGYHGLSAILVVVIATFLFKKIRRFSIATVALIVVLSFVSWWIYKTPEGNDIKVIAVQERIDENVPPITTNADLAVFPEYGFNLTINPSERVKSQAKAGTHYVGSRRIPQQEGHYNRLQFGNTRSGTMSEQDKSRLIPGSEYAPYNLAGLLMLFGQRNKITEFNREYRVIKGKPVFVPLQMSDGTRVGSAICSSIIAPEDYRKLSNNGATVLTNSAALELVANRGFYYQLEGMGRFMASANARPFVQAASGAPALVIDHNGNVVARQNSFGTTHAKVTTNTRKTPYQVLGEWPAILGGAFVIYALLRRLIADKRR